MVGAFVGIFVGVFVGTTVGDFVGTLVGDFVGASVGDFVGTFVGNRVGIFAGRLVGGFLGRIVGARVGHRLPGRMHLRTGSTSRRMPRMPRDPSSGTSLSMLCAPPTPDTNTIEALDARTMRNNKTASCMVGASFVLLAEKCLHRFCLRSCVLPHLSSSRKKAKEALSGRTRSRRYAVLPLRGRHAPACDALSGGDVCEKFACPFIRHFHESVKLCLRYCILPPSLVHERKRRRRYK